MTMKDFKLKLLKNNGTRLYRLEGYDLLVQETNTMIGEFYQLSTKEVLNILNHFRLLKKLRKVIINNHKKENLQAYVCPGLGIIELHAVSELTKGRSGITNERKNTLFTLLHEIGHLKGIMNEPGADEFAQEHIGEFWGKMIKE